MNSIIFYHFTNYQRGVLSKITPSFIDVTCVCYKFGMMDYMQEMVRVGS